MRVKLITNVTGDQLLTPCSLRRVRVGGTAATAGAITIKQGATVIETLPIGTAVGTERIYEDAAFDSNLGALVINMANAGDAVLAFYT